MTQLTGNYQTLIKSGDNYNSIHSEVMRLAIEKMYLQT